MMLLKLKRKLIIEGLLLKLPENSEINRNFSEGKVKVN